MKWPIFARFVRLSGIPILWFVAALVLAALSGLLNLLPVMGVGHLVDYLTGAPQPEQGLLYLLFTQSGHGQSYAMLGIIIALYLIAGIVSIFYGYVSNWLGLRVAHHSRIRVAEAVSRAPLRKLEEEPPGDMLATLTTDIDTVQRAITGPLIGFAVGAFELVWVLVIFLQWNWVLGLGILLASSPLYLLTKWYNSETERLTRVERQETGLLTNLFQESIWAAPMFRIFDARGFQTNRINKGADGKLAAQHSHGKLSMVYWLFVRFIHAVGYAGAIGMALYGVNNHQLTPGSILVAWLFVQRFYGPIVELSRYGNMIHQGQVALEKIERVQEMADSLDMHSSSETRLPERRTQVIVDNITFAYVDKNVLNGITFEVQAGECLAIVGASGEGKSTLARLLLGLYHPDTGSVSVEGVRNASNDRPSVAAVFQDPMLVTGTVLDNILLGEPLNVDRLEAVVRLVDPDLIGTLPNGLETDVGDRGRHLSVGQQQRVALMRALYRKPDLLVADEPTSALDGQAEQRVLAALQFVKAHSAIIVFSHRLSTVKSADIVISIRNGTIQEAGTPDTLAGKEGEFSSLFCGNINSP